MGIAERKQLYSTIERKLDTKIITYVTSDRGNLETQISPDCFDVFVDVLDEIGPTEKISLILHTNGGSTSAAWRLVNLIKTFCETFEVIIPNKAMSAGTLISLGAHSIIMTKQAALGPIDPSLTHSTVAEHTALLLWRLDVISVERIPKPLAVHAVPDFAHVFRLKRIELLGAVNPIPIKPLCHARSDAGNILQLNLKQRRGHRGGPPYRKAVAIASVSLAFLFASLAGDLRQLAICSEAD